MISFRFSGLAAICGTALLFSQTRPAVPPKADTIRVTVNLVEVDALVTDSKGRHVSDLKPEDFTVLEDGKPQEISQVTFVNPEPAPDGQPIALPGGPARMPRREDVHRTIVLMVDNLHTHTDYIAELAPVLRKFLNEQVMPGDLVSVMGTKGGMGLYESFTSDKRQLGMAVEKVLRTTGDNRPPGGETGDGPPNGIAHNGMEDVNNYYIELYHGLAMNALRRAVEGMRDIPGRKTIVFFSNGILFPAGSLDSQQVAFRMAELTKEITILANRYGVVLNTFDPAGLMPPTSLARPMGFGNRAPGLRGFSSAPRETVALNQRGNAISLNEGTAFLARETGGAAVKNTNDLGGALVKAMNDMTGYYLLTWYREEKLGETEKEHRIQVKVRRSGLNVRSRKGYTVTRDANSAPATREQQLSKALFSPFAAGEIGVHLTPLYSASAPDEKTYRREPLLRVAVTADGGGLQFQDAPDGGKQAVLDLALALYDASDRQITAQNKRYTLKATSAQAEAFRNSTVEYQLDVPAIKPGPYQLRAAVRDDTTGNLGSAYTFLAIPDFNKPGLSLSSLVLGNAKGTEGQISSRQFATGAQMSYGCRLFTAQSGPDPSVDIEVRLFREGKQVYASSLMPLTVPAGMKEIPVTGKLNLTDKFAPGEYAMQFIAHDKTGAIDRQTWTDFSIAAPAH